jgi:enoyl-CoA hydratase/carnithine racemase
MGLVQEVVADDALEARLDTFASDLADKSPLVLSRMKAVANASVDMSQAEALVWELSVLRDHLTSNDAAEGLAAFSEKRKPVFAGN